MRVGMRLADQMTNEQLDEFEQFFNAKDDAGAFRWLETNFPNYKEIVADEFTKLKGEVAQTAPQILAATQSETAGSNQLMS
jgi:succinate dehydrogenase flavin-adding protein (antitoxin of CptAB toxin-antitoxin module)